MAHMIETMAYSGELPWHGLGVEVPSDLTPEQMLVKAGLDVHIFNHRIVAGIFEMIATVGAIVQATDRSKVLIEQLNQNLRQIVAQGKTFKRKPRIYFEEWHEPPMSCIQWVSELIEIAGGEDCFKELSTESLGKNRIIVDPTEVVRRNPDIILGSWCFCRGAIFLLSKQSTQQNGCRGSAASLFWYWCDSFCFDGVFTNHIYPHHCANNACWYICSSS